ncbi:Tripartite ATP-independent transporter, DctQ component [Paracoccus isoporae]|uniref:TRAP transporter small permease protein n=1 Tax=Paracoccus isoporae TaxID=591205 RepID=A0A1G6V677_9RHOB|nr:TRAP transporter small permease subunit [Paracoccus isoporae]SDD49112.1 Tripartite ATP-independent transporter, DctQ component [Paracoccus isoporae]
MQNFLRRIDGVIEFLAAIGVLAYCGAALVSVADVIGRRIGTPVPGVVDLVQLFIMAGAWLSIPWGFSVAAHVGVDFLIERLPNGIGRILHGVAATAAILLMILIFIECIPTYRMQVMLGDKSQQLGIPIAFYWLPLLGGVLASVLALIPVVLRLVLNLPQTRTAAH